MLNYSYKTLPFISRSRIYDLGTAVMFSTLSAFYAGNALIAGGFHPQRAKIPKISDIFFVVSQKMSKETLKLLVI